MKFRKLLITPEIAEIFLKKNSHNRKFKPSVVARYANEIINDRWKEDTGECIKISKTGVIIDGQHRLMAIVKSNKAINLIVCTGLNDDVFDVIDSGKSRNSGDVFSIKKIKNACGIPSIITSYEMLKMGYTSSNSHTAQRPTTTYLLDVYELNPMMWDDVSTKSHTWYQQFSKIIHPSVLGSVYCIFKDINEEIAVDFMDQFTSGVDIKNNTIAALRQKLITDKLSSKKLPQSHKIAFIIKTWNAYRSNKVISFLKYDTSREEFPTAK